MNILAIGAHPDDVEFLCAGTLALYASQGHKIFIAIATNGNVGSPTLGKKEISAIRKKESLEACKLINATLIWMNFDDEWLFDNKETRLVFIDAIREAQPDLMFIHNKFDYHPDHRNAGQIAEDCKIPVSVRLVESNFEYLKWIA
jgi:LmbE family N-acetylglucosaminyl deacetylase